MTDEESNEEPPPIIAILNIYKVKIFLNIKSLLFFLFFVSGFCGLLYQIIWLRIAFASFGVISPILSVVISVFMLGLSLGSWAGGKWIPYLKKKTNFSAIIFYGLAEIVIGLGAFAVPNLFTIGGTLLLPLGEINSSQYLFISALILGLSIFPFCFAMGVTYPFMMAFVQESKWEARSSFSFLYLANGIGATFGTIITAVFLVEKLGFSHTLTFGALGNFSLALICLIKGFYDRPNPKVEQPIPSSKISAIENWLLNKKSRAYLVLFITGLTSLAMEVTWVRCFTPVLKTTIYTFAAILATYLFSTLLGSQWYRRDLNKQKTIPALKLIGACFLFSFFPIFLSDPGIHPTRNMLLASIFPLCITLGYLTPKLIDQISQGNPNEAGRAYAINIFGGILGPLLAGYFLIPGFGVKLTLVLLAIPYGVLFLYSTNSNEVSKSFNWVIGIAGTFASIVSVFFITTSELPTGIGKGFLVLRDSTATVVAFGEGMKKRLLVNGIGITHLTPITKMMAHLPLSIRKRKPESALIIALGMGTTLRSAASWGIDVKCVELVPSVVEALPYFFEDASSVLSQPNVEVIIDDGRRFLNRTQKKYDAIIIDPPPPVEAASTSLLYSREFYKSLAEHLKKDGIVQHWFAYGEKKIFEAVVRSLVDVFPYIRVYKSLEGWGFHFLASMEPFQTPSSKDSVSRLPTMAKDDLVEWAKGKELFNDLEREKQVEEYFNLSFENEIPVELLLNQKDKSIFISDDRPYNEYFFLRRYNDKKSGSYEWIQ
jgi:predicted membrane-bound spermidine synthase